MRQSHLPQHSWLVLLTTTAVAGCMTVHPLESRDSRQTVQQLPLSCQVAAQRPQGKDEFSADRPGVAHFVNSFQTRRRKFFRDALERSGKYRPRMVAILERAGVPTELVYVPLIESGYRPSVVSPAGAAGLWQFIRETGRRYGLRVDAYVDERRDPIKSTRAAARYLRDLHDRFGSWPLSLAAYNVGAQRIAYVLERRKDSTYWDMQRSLPRETIDYVPQFLAAVHIARTPEAHGFAPPADVPLQYDLVRVHRSLTLRAIAQLAGVSVAELTELNPALVRSITPPDRRGYQLRLPKGAKARFKLACAGMDRRIGGTIHDLEPAPAKCRAAASTLCENARRPGPAAGGGSRGSQWSV